jgi:hypothetical protein
MPQAKGKTTLKFAIDKSLPAPKPKAKVEEIAELKDALSKLPKGANILCAGVDVAVARVHVQRAQKDEKNKPENERRTFVTRQRKEDNGSLRVWAV